MKILERQRLFHHLIRLFNLLKIRHLTIMAGHGLRVGGFEKFYNDVHPEEVLFRSGARVNESFNDPIDKNKKN